MLKWLGNQWREAKSKGESYGVPFLILGAFVVILIGILTIFGIRVEVAIFNSGIATMSFGLGLIALGRGTRSEEQMKALVKIEYEARWESITNLLKDGTLLRPIEIEGVIRTRHREFLSHIKAMAILAKWAGREEQVKVGKLLDSIIGDKSLPKGGVYDEWINELNGLRKHFH